MALVGDVIMVVRSLGPDPPGVIPPPSALAFSAVSLAGSTLAAGTYYVKATFTNPWGETTPQAEATVAISSGQAIQVSGTLPSNANSVNVYIGTASGAENAVASFTSLPGNIGAYPSLAASPPAENTAYNPDSNGGFVSASVVYQWLREAVQQFGMMSNGIKDITGIGSSLGQGMYPVIGTWRKVTNAWYDGWLMSKISRDNFYYHNSATGITWMIDVSSLRNNFPTIDTWPQANRTSTSTTLTSALSSTASTANVAAPANMLPLGLVAIGNYGSGNGSPPNPSQIEIVQYAQIGSGQLLGLVRGLGGTQPQAWPSGTAVTELNLRIAGKRMPNPPGVGNSTLVIDVPAGTESILTAYLLSRYREAEQDGANAQRLLKAFYDAIDQFARSEQQISGPVQVGGTARETYGSLPRPPIEEGENEKVDSEVGGVCRPLAQRANATLIMVYPLISNCMKWLARLNGRRVSKMCGNLRVATATKGAYLYGTTKRSCENLCFDRPSGRQGALRRQDIKVGRVPNLVALQKNRSSGEIEEVTLDARAA
jgi:hypothetical protein